MGFFELWGCTFLSYSDFCCLLRARGGVLDLRALCKVMLSSILHCAAQTCMNSILLFPIQLYSIYSKIKVACMLYIQYPFASELTEVKHYFYFLFQQQVGVRLFHLHHQPPLPKGGKHYCCADLPKTHGSSSFHPIYNLMPEFSVILFQLPLTGS